ncbi:MAG: DEAD/DEAH box helicase [Magnetococcales bacterium]|nr:DEAD/DEAH box helicase [Magnetococcales bacterium]
MSANRQEEFRTQLLAVFERLPKLQRIILQLLSVFHGSVHRADLAKYLYEIGVTGDAGRMLSVNALMPILSAMGKQKIFSDNPYFFSCHEAIAWDVTLSAVKEGTFHKMAAAAQKLLPAISNYSYRYQGYELVSYNRCLREIRIGLFSQDAQQVESYLQLARAQYPEDVALSPPLLTLCMQPFNAQWFAELPKAIQLVALEEMVPFLVSKLEPLATLQPLLAGYRLLAVEEGGDRFRALWVITLLAQGDLAVAQEVLHGDLPVADAQLLEGWWLFLRGENEAALERYEKVFRKGGCDHKICFAHLGAPFFLLALLKGQDPTQIGRVAEFLAFARKKKLLAHTTIYQSLEALLLAQRNELVKGGLLLDAEESSLAPMLGHASRHLNIKRIFSLGFLFKSVVRYWIHAEQDSNSLTELKMAFEQAKREGYRWVAMEYAELLSRAGVPEKEDYYHPYARTVQEETGLRSLLPIVPKEEGWERALRALLLLSPGKEKVGKPGKEGVNRRLIWLIRLSGSMVDLILPKEQSMNANGTWSKGRMVGLNRLADKDLDLHFLTEQDWRIVQTLEREYVSYGRTRLLFPWQKAMLAMVGHPLVFWEESPSVRVEVVRAEPELMVQKARNQIKVQFAQQIVQQGVIASQDSPTRCQLIEVTAAHKAIADVLGAEGLHIPTQGKDQVLSVMHALSPLVTIQSAIGGGQDSMESIPADSRPHVQLRPFGAGLKLTLLVRPFGSDGPYFVPGKGGRTIIAEVGGKRVQTHRALPEEQSRVMRLMAACPSLAAGEDMQAEWCFEEPDSCLELLSELQELRDEVQLEWPEGERLRVSRPVSMEQLRVQVQRDNDWFAMKGELRVDDAVLLEMDALLALVLNGSSRFIPLGDGQFVALTEKFRKQLLELEAFSSQSGRDRRFHPLAAPLLQEIAEQAQWVKVDREWKQHLQQIQASQALTVVLPSTLQAELRDYQLAGYYWLSRLAAWGVGACLADDMGLGKTIQALALILSRAKEGPVLVVAPTSVCLNWVREIEQFAPTLQAILLASSRRQQTLDGLKPYDVLICSYGLLQQEGKILAAVSWQVVVLDEAQAIKNRGTKRSKAAMALKGSFKMILTGTPIENHLGELWNLFHFINPGLLGSIESFNNRFATPIERYSLKEARGRLKKLIQPFILRRTKSQVLAELPPRTEITLQVEMSPEETAFYEALRRRAIEQIENMEGSIEQHQLQIFAEIMRLRRACCNSRLIVPDSPIASTKLELFWSVVEGLLENRHKVLVFSQFVDHLAIIRERLEQEKVRYQYLDGSTPMQERQRRVEAFQAGEGDLFLISLRAGGMGINLTAADYVIHMDPWWNPAVEDQAADRAHRIGQQRPVTIYRLVTKGTIEEMIVELHQHKRSLADGLLDGSDVSGRLTASDLLRIIRGQEV